MTAEVVRQSKSRPVIFSLLTLLSGIVIGAGITLIFVGSVKKDASPPLPEEFSRRTMRHLTRELGLTPQQQENIRPVVEAHMEVLDEIRREARPRIRQELETMNNEILALLDEKQQHMWKKKIERMQRRFQEFRKRRGSGPGDRRERRDGDRRGFDRDGWGPRNGEPSDRRPDRFRREERPHTDPNSPPLRR